MTGHRRAEAIELLAGGGVVAFTGAGVSQESGIPTFRDRGGLWERFDPDAFGTWEGLQRTAMRRPDALARFLGELRSVLARADPGPAHHALARLERAGLLGAVITQNVDGLHQEAGSRRVVELHGSLARISCLACGHRARISRGELLEALDRAVGALRSAFVPSFAALLPSCPRCGGPARPNFVAFGEPTQELEDAEALAASCRVMLVVGTRGEVYPAASLPASARRAGAAVVEVSLGGSDVESDLRLDGRAGQILPPLVDEAMDVARSRRRA